jgi:endogenous inhibitor of DNA gyrase (YacG/DUF329 family)
MNDTARIIRCPQCGRSTRYDENNPDRPFCSSRCKTQDIAQWAEESYRIPSQELNPDEDEAKAMREGRPDHDED